MNISNLNSDRLNDYIQNIKFNSSINNKLQINNNIKRKVQLSNIIKNNINKINLSTNLKESHFFNEKSEKSEKSEKPKIVEQAITNKLQSSMIIEKKNLSIQNEQQYTVKLINKKANSKLPMGGNDKSTESRLDTTSIYKLSNLNIRNQNKPIVIIQTSPTRTGSTFLVNLLYGFLIPNERIRFYSDINASLQLFNNFVNIYKCHILEIDAIINKFSHIYELYFICSERDNNVINNKYRNLPNIIIFDYSEINETEFVKLKDIIDNAYDKLKKMLPNKISNKLNKNTALNRIIKMNKLYEEIKDKPFTYIDPFFELHGSHRNRDGNK